MKPSSLPHICRPWLILGLAAALAVCLIAALATPEPILVLAYHRVAAGNTGPVPAVTPGDFARQLDYLERAGYQSISPGVLASYLDGRGRLPRRAVLITFDDGWADNYTTAWPLLRARHFTATVFMVSGRIGRANCLSDAQLLALQRAGWTIGAHTVSHRHLSALSPREAADEILRSRNVLRHILHAPVDAFAYPYGDQNEAVRALARSAGFNICFATNLGFPRRGDDTRQIKRLVMPRRGGRLLLYLATASWLNSARRCCAALLASAPAVRAQEAYCRRLWPARRQSRPRPTPRH